MATAGRPRRRWRAQLTGALGSGLLCTLLPALAAAQITIDGSLGPPQALSGPNYVISAEAGQVRGSNLFHSFGVFNVNTGESATFTGPASIANVLSRVTGGEQSLIDGPIDSRTSMPNANFFFLNPSGVIFGPGASLKVGGSFHVSSADYIRFSDGTQFFARLSETSALSVAPPAAFGFLGPGAGPIAISGSALFVDPGKSISVVGGPVTVTGATLQASGGQVQLAAAAERGELPVGDVRAGAVPLLGPVEVNGGSFLDATGDPGGTVMIRAGRLVIDGAVISTGTGDLDGAAIGIDLLGQDAVAISGASSVSTLAAGSGRAGDIVISSGTGSPGTGSVELSGFSAVVTLTAGPGSSGPGRGGDVRLSGGRLVIGDSSAVASQSLGGEGVAGDVILDGGTIAILGGGSIQSFNQSFTGAGRGGNIDLLADSIEISGQSEFGGASLVLSGTDTAGDGGRISIRTPSLVMNGGQILSSASFGEGPNGERPGGAGGSIDVDVGQLSMAGGALMRSFVSTTVPGVPGRGGAVTVSVDGHADVSGFGSGIFSFASQADPTDVTTPGDIVVDVGTLRLSDRALIQGGSPPPVDSQGGNVTVRAADSILIEEFAGISSQAFNLEVGQVAVSAGQRLTLDRGFINTGTLGDGRAGDTLVEVGTLTLSRGGQIASSSSALATGAGGNVTVSARESVSISGSSPEPVLPPPFQFFVRDTASGIFSNASSASPDAGAAGSIAVSTPSLGLSEGGKISVATEGTGAAGNIALEVGALSLAGGSRIDSSTSGAGRGGVISISAPAGHLNLNNAGLFSDTTSTGIGGDITIVADTIELNAGATISAASSGSDEALAGNISVTFGTRFELNGSTVTTQSSRADGGNISITSTGSVLHLLDSRITTSVESDIGSGGNITIGSAAHPVDFVVLDGSEIRADAFGGPGGNIGLFADVFLASGTLLSASSALSAPGVIDIQADVTDVSSAVAQLPSDIVQAATLLRAACTARLAAGRTSSLVLAGRDGVPPEPDGLLSSPILAAMLTSLAPWSSPDDRSGEGLWELARVSLIPRCAR